MYINKVIKLLKFRSTVNCQFLMRANSIIFWSARNLIRVALSQLRHPLETVQIHCRYKLLKLYNFVNKNQQYGFLHFYYNHGFL